MSDRFHGTTRDHPVDQIEPAQSVSRREFVGRGVAAATGVILAHRGAQDLPAALLSRWHLPSQSSSDRLIPNIRYGAAVLDFEVKSASLVAPLVVEHCGVIVPTGPMHWRYLRPAPDRFDFSRADACVEFAEAHALLVRGHTLVWHQMTPDWLASAITPGNGFEILQQHIITVLRHFAGRIHSWDVVNEVAWPWDRQQEGLRNSFWLNNLGPDYIPRAFLTARAADPKALLGYNENGIEDDSARADIKRAAVLALLRRWVESGVPIDYLGVQSHLAGGQSYSDAKLGRFLRDVRALGLSVYITELDVDDRAFPSDFSMRDTAVAGIYERYLDVALGATEIPIVVTWGLTDRTSWLQRYAPRADGMPQRPLPFDAALKPKPAWDVLRRKLGVT